MNAAVSKTDSIRRALRDGDGPMTKNQVWDALPDSVDPDTVSALLSQRTKAGEFKVEIIDGKAHYSLNTHGAKVAPTASSKTPAAATKGATKPASPEAVDVFAAVAAQVAGESVQHDEIQMSPPAKTTREATALLHLFDRMHAISRDLDAALIAAIELNADKAIILELVTARGGTTAALIAGLRH